MEGTKTDNTAQQQFLVKLSCGPEEKRLVTLEQASYNLLVQKVASALGLQAGTFALRYVDDEKDLITASSDEELQLALNFASTSGVLHLQVVQLRQPAAGEKRRRSGKHSASDLESDVDQQAVTYLVQQMRELHDKEVKPKKCAKFLRRTDGDVALAQAALDAWCHKRSAKELRKKEKKAFKQQLKKDKGSADQERGHDEEAEAMGLEAPEVKEKLDHLEAKGYAKRKKNFKLLMRCNGDVEKVLEVLQHKEAKKEAKKEWKQAKQSRKHAKKAHKREHKLERKGSKAAFKHHKKQFKHEAKMLKQQYRAGYQELSVSPSSPVPTVGA